jgi:hypothetical protein
MAQVVQHLPSKCKALHSKNTHPKEIDKINKNKKEQKNGKKTLGMVVHTCNPSYLGGGSKRLIVTHKQVKAQDPV